MQWFVGKPQQSVSVTHVPPSAMHELPESRTQWRCTGVMSGTSTSHAAVAGVVSAPQQSWSSWHTAPGRGSKAGCGTSPALSKTAVVDVALSWAVTASPMYAVAPMAGVTVPEFVHVVPSTE